MFWGWAVGGGCPKFFSFLFSLVDGPIKVNHCKRNKNKALGQTETN
jgi:hypothetical protein